MTRGSVRIILTPIIRDAMEDALQSAGAEVEILTVQASLTGALPAPMDELAQEPAET